MSTTNIHQSFKDIAHRFSVSEEQIGPILERIKIKTAEVPSEEQLKGFEKVCTMLKSGMPLDQAVQSLHEEAKTHKTQGTKAAPSPSPTEAALAQTNQAAIATLGQDVPQGVKAGLDSISAEAAQLTLKQLPQLIAQTTNTNEQHLTEGVVGFVTASYQDHIAKGLQDPQFLEAVRQAMAAGKSRNTSATKSPS
uniref:Uncharacterized protein n=1 Tax=Cyanothece sp. (strain PCC 7425 / ATCC 29141) TaxID=395961 RepID=B8HYZ8_CYAP4